MSTSSDSFHTYLNYNVGIDGGSHRFLYADTIGSAKPILTLDYQYANLTTNSLNFRASGNAASARDCGIDIASVNTTANDKGTMSLNAATINIGTSTSTVNITGNVNMSGASFTISSGSFFAQW